MASPQTLARRYVGKQPLSRAAMDLTETIQQTTSNVINNSSSKPSAFSSMKHGIGRLTATADPRGNTSSNSSTKLTEISHKAPMRWLPLKSSRVEQAGAAVAAMSNYGAGLLPGDVNELHVQVQAQAKLGVLTQGSNRIYKQSSSPKQQHEIIPAKSTLNAQVHQEGLLVVAPDPTVPFASALFRQQQHFRVHPTSSLVAIDWFSSGRYANQERWQAERVASETKLSLLLDDNNEEHLLVWDATTLDQQQPQQQQLINNNNNNNNNPFGFDLGQHSFNAFASVLLYGEQSLPVVEQLKSLEYQLAESQTRLRRRTGSAVDDNDIILQQQGEYPPGLLGTTGRVLLGVNELEVTPLDATGAANNNNVGPVHMARWVASSNEDLYRMLHHSLKPLAPLFGLEFYQERIRATSSGPVVNSANYSHKINASKAQTFPSVELPTSETASTDDSVATTSKSTPQASWNAYMLADSALPTGSFAHSSGLEAASQLGLLAPLAKAEAQQNNTNDEDMSNLQMFIQASTRSTLQQATPWILSGHELGRQCVSSLGKGHEEIALPKLWEVWEQLDRHVHAVMVCNGPACRASLDQGRNLLRVSIPWLEQDSSPGAAGVLQLFQAIQEHSHAVTSATNNGNAAAIGYQMAPLFGILGAALQLQPEETCHLLGYCVARDIVSAAVRLNLIGPLASVGLLSKAQVSAQEGIATSLRHQENGKEGEENLLWSSSLVGGSAPVVDAVHPCHDLLAVRLFRT